MAGKKGATGSKSKPKTSNSGSKNTKNSNNSQNTEQDAKQTVTNQNRKHQQRVLDIFRHAFAETLSSPDFTSTLQSVKQALFDRDFAKAFSDPHHLEVYAARWSPTRALCYAAVLGGITEHLRNLYSPSTLNTTPSQTDIIINNNQDEPPTPSSPTPNLPVLSIGGGPAELVALASFLTQHTTSPSSSSVPVHSTLTLLDSGPYTPLINTLTTALTTPPPISPYASTAAKQANVPFLLPFSGSDSSGSSGGEGKRLEAVFYQRDALTLDEEGWGGLFSSSLLPSSTSSTAAEAAAAETVSAPPPTGTATTASSMPKARTPPHLITLFFTLNELFTAGGLAPTTRFLLALTAAAPVGSLLLVVDSPGSYSEVVMGGGGTQEDMQQKKKREYPMGWLLDRVLVGVEDREGEKDGDREKRWRKVEERESVWFRLGTGLEYPIGLEDMRYQMHLYRLDVSSSSS